MSGDTEVAHLQSALRNIINALGPEHLCTCQAGSVECGLRDEAQEALDLARGALGIHP